MAFLDHIIPILYSLNPVHFRLVEKIDKCIKTVTVACLGHNASPTSLQTPALAGHHPRCTKVTTAENTAKHLDLLKYVSQLSKESMPLAKLIPSI